MINEIDIEEFFRRIDLIVPGGICNDSKINLPVSQVKFSKLSINDLDDIHSYSIIPTMASGKVNRKKILNDLKNTKII